MDIILISADERLFLGPARDGLEKAGLPVAVADSRAQALRARP